MAGSFNRHHSSMANPAASASMQSQSRKGLRESIDIEAPVALGQTISKRVSFPAEFCPQQIDENSIARADSNNIVHGEILMLDHESNNSPATQSIKSNARVNNFQMDSRSNTDLLGAFHNHDPNKSLPDSVHSVARNSNYLDEYIFGNSLEKQNIIIQPFS